MKAKVLIIIGILLICTGGVFAFLRKQTPVTQLQTQNMPTAVVSQTTTCGAQTVAEEEGPYYKKGSPERTDLTESGMPGTKLTLTGYVLNTHCKPLSHAWLDFWQADSNGHYDNSGYTLRGHQYTDANGKFTLITVVPGEYPGRTPHIHVKVRASNQSPVFTTQLYLPGLASNAQDAIYNPTLLMKNVKDTSSGKTATFTFVVKP